MGEPNRAAQAIPEHDAPGVWCRLPVLEGEGVKTLPRSNVPWATHQWPILRGCSAVSEGCQNCYAKGWYHRFAASKGYPAWGTAHYLPENLRMPYSLKKPARIFVAPMSDLYNEDVNDDMRTEIMDIISWLPEHTFIILTKRAHRLPINCAWLPNIWLGVTCENQARAEERIPHLIQCNVSVRFVSIEPMLGPVDLTAVKFPDTDITENILNDTPPSFEKVMPGCKLNRIDWVQCGPETGRGKRPCSPLWIDQVGVDCKVHGVPFFDKRDMFIRREYPKGKA